MSDSNTCLLDTKQVEPTHARPAIGSSKLVAPMPGTIVLCEKNVGEEVLRGDVVLILEAMKMENLITSPITGTVLSIFVRESEKVERGTVLGVIGREP